jgi:shikimate kinase
MLAFPGGVERLMGKSMTPLRTTPLNVILIGFMGCGKTTIGVRLAGLLGFDFVDTDALIVAKAGMPIPQIFQEQGEAGFRALETGVLDELAAQGCERTVISTGGGIVTQPVNSEKLRALGVIVWLTTSDDILWQRVRRNRERPMLHTKNPRQTFNELLALRRPMYAGLADLTIDSRGLSPEEAAYGMGESVRVYFNPGS